MARRSESVTGVNSVFDRRSASNSRSHRRSIDEKRTVSRIDEQEGALVRGTEDVPRRKRRATSDGREPLVVYMLPNCIKALKIAAVELDSTASAIVGEAVTAWLLKSARRAAT